LAQARKGRHTAMSLYVGYHSAVSILSEGSDGKTSDGSDEEPASPTAHLDGLERGMVQRGRALLREAGQEPPSQLSAVVRALVELQGLSGSRGC